MGYLQVGISFFGRGGRRSYELKICAREMIQAALEGVSASAEGSTHNTEQSVPEKRVRTSGEAQTKLF